MTLKGKHLTILFASFAKNKYKTTSLNPGITRIVLPIIWTVVYSFSDTCFEGSIFEIDVSKIWSGLIANALRTLLFSDLFLIKTKFSLRLPHRILLQVFWVYFFSWLRRYLWWSKFLNVKNTNNDWPNLLNSDFVNEFLKSSKLSTQSFS